MILCYKNIYFKKYVYERHRLYDNTRETGYETLVGYQENNRFPDFAKPYVVDAGIQTRNMR